MRSRNTARTALGVTALVGLIVAEKRLMFVWWRWIKHRFPRLHCGRSWHGSFLPRAASKGKCRPAQGYAASILRPRCSGDTFRTDQRGCAWSCVLLATHPPPTRGLTLVRGRVCYAATSPRPALSGPPLRGRARTLSRLRRVPPFARRIPYGNTPPKARSVPNLGNSERNFSKVWKNIFQGLEDRSRKVPRFGTEFSNAWKIRLSVIRRTPER